MNLFKIESACSYVSSPEKGEILVLAQIHGSDDNLEYLVMLWILLHPKVTMYLVYSLGLNILFKFVS